jgi:arylsulfatase A
MAKGEGMEGVEDGLMINRRDFLKGVCMGVAWMGLERSLLAGEMAEDRPNFVLILVDDLGWTDLGCFGSQYYETPNIDRLASGGMRFTDAYAACAVCSPTRAAVMTGRYPARVGITDWIRARFQGGKIPQPGEQVPEYEGNERKRLLCPRNPLWMELEEVTIAESLKPAGYISCHIGKWHLGADDWHPDRQGFDFNIGGCDFGQPPSYFDPYYRPGQGSIPTLKPRRKGEYLTDREGDEAVGFIEKHKGRPFFLYMSHYAVHTPLQAKKDLMAKYMAKPTTNHSDPTYGAMVESVDEAVGKIMASLDELGLADRTMVVFTSDNGGLLGPTHNSPLRAGKGHPYEGGIRVPLIIRWPGVIKAGSVCHVPVTSVDYFPTVMEAAGVKLPSDRMIDGESLMPLLRQEGSLRRDAIFWHFPHYRGGIVPYSIVRSCDWKLIKRYEGKTFELFNLKNDIGEGNDLSEQMGDKVKRLDAELTSWLRKTGARLPKKNPDYRAGKGK